jgi:hypothetical protein
LLASVLPTSLTKFYSRSIYFLSCLFIKANTLKQADVPRDQAAEILGHDRGKDVTYGRYGKPAEAKRQLEVIKKLNFSLNLG